MIFRQNNKIKNILSVRFFSRLAGSLIMIVFFLWISGFLFFIYFVATLHQPKKPVADGIVVLTGGYQRLKPALALLQEGIGRRLLISGVNPATKRRVLRNLEQKSPSRFDCCVDLGYKARNTLGNALETADWAKKNGFRSLLVVTNNYHMPRSLFELKRAMPNVKLIPFPIINSKPAHFDWLISKNVMKTMVLEYIKLTAAYFLRLVP